MKKEELMIGDLVLWKGNVVKVEAIAFNKVTIYDFNEEKGELECEVEITELETIPLTKDILSKQGFMLTGGKWNRWDSWCDETIWEIDGLQGLKIVLCGKRFYVECGSNKLWCGGVHQLQHVFNHFGIDKEIEV